MKRERIINTGRSGKRNSEIYNITKRTMDNIYISPAEEQPWSETPTIARERSDYSERASNYLLRPIKRLSEYLLYI